MSWYRKNLGDALLAGVMLDDIRTDFYRRYAESSLATPAGLFQQHVSDGQLHCDLVIYLTPAAHALAQSIQATPCRQPERNGLGLVAGAAGTWQVPD